eukprot:CAMPEP_0170223590 /NCGR_PEP_ID=MMETSP0116_2-20130129/11495_1 /TAXON_ID=400756 /ORGANISM="Durinskia baltica, Strain CSIRO CS-38" /LENGTH=177 /DNA_ID=CAMNT_0010474293 /DNA_START=64 /DNA_END=593 /DNA_ORIENTATION=-
MVRGAAHQKAQRAAMVRGAAHQKAAGGEREEAGVDEEGGEPDGGEEGGLEDCVPRVQGPDDELQVLAAALRVQASEGDVPHRGAVREMTAPGAEAARRPGDARLARRLHATAALRRWQLDAHSSRQPAGRAEGGPQDGLPRVQGPDDELQVPAAALRVQTPEGDLPVGGAVREVTPP